jgi:hypothetical protein
MCKLTAIAREEFSTQTIPIKELAEADQYSQEAVLQKNVNLFSHL